MAINGIQSYGGHLPTTGNIGGHNGSSVKFGQVTNGYRAHKAVENPYHQAYLPSTSDMEKALAYIETGKVNNPYASSPIQKTNTDMETKGAGWEGFTTKAYNGTGELSPTISGREDAIPGVDWDNLYA